MSAIRTENSTKYSGSILSRTYKLRSLVRQPPEDDREPQREPAPAVTRVEARQFSRAAQPVPHRIRVHEQHPRRRLQRVPLLQIRRHGVDQRGAAALQRMEDVLDQLGPRAV